MLLKSKAYNLLRKTQKYTRTDNVYLFKSGFWLTLPKAVSFLSILSGIAFANLVSKETYGTYQYILSILGILSIATLQSMKTAVAQAVARGYEGSVKKAVISKIKWGLLGSVGSILFSAYYFYHGNATLGWAFVITAALLPFLNPFSLYAAYLEGSKNFKLLSIFSILSTAVSIAAIIVILFITDNVLLIILGDLLVGIIVAFAFFNIVIKKFPPNAKEDPKTIPFGTRVSLIKIIPTIARELDQIIIWHFLGAAQVAIYAFAQKIPTQLSDNLSVLNQLAFPKMSAASSDDLKKNLPKKIIRLYAMIIPLGIAYILSVPFVFKIFFPQYLDSILYAQIFSFFIFFFPLSFISQTFDAKMQEKNILITSIFSPTLRIILLLILTPTIGVMGVVLTRLINSFATNLLAIFLFLKK
ncbi:MAG: hypothetical protein A3B96_01170 [Candidatus Spechtbacteria bacterium RIFCSPHIGHO2_02_FULL_43_15b]|uniref:Polysaccharide biosynthesis protein C-terminal domain-containing protein n=1 Tax=Candidatus Spechtbacteria bacterium RIFCSPHIGHO2_01_FULL_43_30 TaxID=1802158 RepID=A0A1G2H4E7_9BACT|nr:MAG: hypothetical protein A2827_03570 [Candidatus Spechtbacteria bacterium RIFCSPHIGHO2_01_FULL_43_30]OGZ59024.1 MAG: hypothetical protein A3B96_01170 [Candidatus Spechtbacteria bacterium RIFCSPHIGHO2_02_FULL_43_15b]